MDHSNRELRLEERCPGLRIEKTGRGRFRFNVLRPVALSEIQPNSRPQRAPPSIN